MSKAGVSDAFRDVSVDPNQTHKSCYVVGDVLVAHLRLAFGWAGSTGVWG